MNPTSFRPPVNAPLAFQHFPLSAFPFVPNAAGGATFGSMNLDETQRKQVAAWIAEGLKIGDLQKRMEAQWGLRLTYLEVRLLVDDLKLTPKDPPAPPPPHQTAAKAGESLPPPDLPAGNVRLTLDQITRAGAMTSAALEAAMPACLLDRFSFTESIICVMQE